MVHHEKSYFLITKCERATISFSSNFLVCSWIAWLGVCRSLSIFFTRGMYFWWKVSQFASVHFAIRSWRACLSILCQWELSKGSRLFVSSCCQSTVCCFLFCLTSLGFLPVLINSQLQVVATFTWQNNSGPYFSDFWKRLKHKLRRWHSGDASLHPSVCFISGEIYPRCDCTATIWLLCQKSNSR